MAEFTATARLIQEFTFTVNGKDEDDAYAKAEQMIGTISQQADMLALPDYEESDTYTEMETVDEMI